jgi:hypothetical protein
VNNHLANYFKHNLNITPLLHHFSHLSLYLHLLYLTPLSPIQQASANPSTQTSLLPRTSAPAATIEPAFKVQDLPEDPTSALTFTTPMVFAPALAELTPPSTPKMAPALSPATYILTKP